MVQNDGFLELLADALEQSDNRIQGFLYADHHVIRDVSKRWGQQEIWRLKQDGPGDYDACHDAMMRQINIEKLRIAVSRALAMMRNPWPGQEVAAAHARLAASGIEVAEASETEGLNPKGESPAPSGETPNGDPQ